MAITGSILNRQLRKRGAIPYPVWRSKCNFPRKIIPRIRATEATEAPKSLSATPLSKQSDHHYCLSPPSHFLPHPIPLNFPLGLARRRRPIFTPFSSRKHNFSVGRLIACAEKLGGETEIGNWIGRRTEEGREEGRGEAFLLLRRKSNQRNGGEVWRRRSGGGGRGEKERKVLLTAVFCSDIFLNPFPHLISLSPSETDAKCQ